MAPSREALRRRTAGVGDQRSERRGHGAGTPVMSPNGYSQRRTDRQ